MTQDETYTVVVFSREAAHKECMNLYAHAQAILLNGDNVQLSAGPALDAVGIKQRNFLHGVVLKQISEQVYVGEKRERFTIDTWKEYYFKRFIPPKWAMRKLPGQKRRTPHKVDQSSEDLGVRRYAKWIDEIIDDATVEWGVLFVLNPKEREETRFKARPKANPS